MGVIIGLPGGSLIMYDTRPFYGADLFFIDIYNVTTHCPMKFRAFDQMKVVYQQAWTKTAYADPEHFSRPGTGYLNLPRFDANFGNFAM